MGENILTIYWGHVFEEKRDRSSTPMPSHSSKKWGS